MKFNRTGREYYDCTSDSDVELEREMSVIDFVKEVLDRLKIGWLKSGKRQDTCDSERHRIYRKNLRGSKNDAE